MRRPQVTLWGGIPFSLLTPTYSDQEFESYVVDLYRAVAPGDRFILGFGDNVPPEALFHAENGSYPLRKQRQRPLGSQDRPQRSSLKRQPLRLTNCTRRGTMCLPEDKTRLHAV